MGKSAVLNEEDPVQVGRQTSFLFLLSPLRRFKKESLVPSLERNLFDLISAIEPQNDSSSERQAESNLLQMCFPRMWHSIDGSQHSSQPVYLTCSKEPHIDPGEIFLIRKRMQTILKWLVSDEGWGELRNATGFSEGDSCSFPLIQKAGTLACKC